MKIKYAGLLCLGLNLTLPGIVFADTDLIENKDPSETPLVFSGFIDGSLNYLKQSNLFTSGVFDRVYDLEENGPTLQQAAGTFSYLPTEGIGVFLNGMVGRDAIVSNAYGMGTWTSSPDFGVDVTQAYVRFATAPTFTVDFGKYVTLNGVETIAPITDTNFSRAILFGYAGPFTALGGRATYTPNDKLKLIAGLNDGWDTIRDFSRGKTLELNATYIFSPLFTLAITGYNGEQRIVDRTSSGPIGSRTLVDVVATFNATEKLTFLANYDYAWQTRAALADGTVGRALWNGVAGYANYKIDDWWRVSLRGELFNDRDGFRTGVAQTWRELTFTVGFIPKFNKDIEIRGEARRDRSNVPSFLQQNLVGTRDYQQSVALEAFYKFG